MEFLQTNWHWITSNSWGALGLSILCFTLGWAAARLIYQERLELLKEKSSKHSIEESNVKFIYAEHGRYGKNILSNAHTSIVLNEHVSLRAEIPNRSKLHVEIKGPMPTTLDDNEASWYFAVGKSINWSAKDYESSLGGRQSFYAESGVAEKELHFSRTGEMKIIAYEGDSQIPSWSKTLTVREASEK